MILMFSNLIASMFVGMLHLCCFCCRKIKVWDLVAALDPRALANTLCLRTLVVRFMRIILSQDFELFMIIITSTIYGNYFASGTHRACIPSSV